MHQYNNRTGRNEMNKEKAVEIKNALEEMKDMMPYMIEAETQKAIIIKARYDSLIRAGFEEDKAIEICIGEYK